MCPFPPPLRLAFWGMVKRDGVLVKQGAAEAEAVAGTRCEGQAHFLSVVSALDARSRICDAAEPCLWLGEHQAACTSASGCSRRCSQDAFAFFAFRWWWLEDMCIR